MAKDATTIIKKEFTRLQWLVAIIFAILLALHAIAYLAIVGRVWGGVLEEWLPELLISTAILIVAGLLSILAIGFIGYRTHTMAAKTMKEQLGQLRTASNRARSLEAMAATLSATLSFEKVMEVALDVCSMALEELGVPSRTLVGAVFLYDGEELVPAASRRFVARDYEKRLLGQKGIIGTALRQAEPAFTNKPNQDVELQNFVAFQNCQVVICMPLRAGFQIFGAMVLGTEAMTEFDEEHLELFDSIAKQAVVALQNAQLYQRLEAEKLRIIEADEEARKELARDLHDGPTQSIAAIAMRINFIRSLLAKDPPQAFTELKKVEDLAKQTSKEIRSMLFALRPLVLETQGLAAAIETVMNRIRETDGLNMRLVGGEFGELLNEQAQGVVFYIIEEALGNARKYARANLVEVRLWREGDLFVARVQDDGAGFDPVAVNANYSSRGSLGMVNMRERAERINGSLKVESTPGRGTTITLVVPLETHGRKAPNDM